MDTLKARTPVGHDMFAHVPFQGKSCGCSQGTFHLWRWWEREGGVLSNDLNQHGKPQVRCTEDAPPPSLQGRTWVGASPGVEGEGWRKPFRGPAWPGCSVELSLHTTYWRPDQHLEDQTFLVHIIVINMPRLYLCQWISFIEPLLCAKPHAYFRGQQTSSGEATK